MEGVREGEKWQESWYSSSQVTLNCSCCIVVATIVYVVKITPYFVFETCICRETREI